MTVPPRETTHIPTTTPGVAIAAHHFGGMGPELLLIHGIGSSSKDFAPVIEGLCQFCQPIALDLRGHGDSSRPEHGYRYEDYVQDLTDVFAQLGLEHPRIIGHSLGGIVTLIWAAMNPGAPLALVIEDAPLRSGTGFANAFEGWLTLNALPQATARAWYADQNPGWTKETLDNRSFDMVNTKRAAIEELQQAMQANRGLNAYPAISTITAPLLFLVGDSVAGSMVNLDDLNDLQALLPEMERVAFPGAGHTIHRSHPEAWLRSVREFIERRRS